MKKFFVIGLGSFGFTVAVSLAAKGNEVIVIDISSGKIESIKKNVSDAVIADSTKIEVLKKFAVHESDGVIVSIGSNLEASIMTLHNLKKLGVTNIIAKAKSEEHYSILKLIGADRIIYPEKDEAVRLSNSLGSNNILEFFSISDELAIEEIKCPKKFFGKTIKELDLRNKYKILVIGIRSVKNNKVEAIPDPDMILQNGDAMYVFGERQKLQVLQ